MYDEDIQQLYQTVKGDGTPFKRARWTNKSCLDYKRLIVSSRSLGMAFLQYYFKNSPERAFDVDPHGSRKKEVAYDRLRDSAKKKLVN